MSEQLLKFNVNGIEREVKIKPSFTLAFVLRNKLNLTGTKIACREAECGTCTVLVDNEPVLSCTYPALRAQGKSVVTIEGIARHNEAGETELHPLQQAFISHGAVQCGFCIPGQIMTSYALLEQNPDPESEDIKDALKETLCRCAGYPTIERAVLAAAESMKTGEPVSPPEVLPSGEPLKMIGRLTPRPDAVAKVTGDAVFTDDIKFDDMLAARVKRTLIPHAIVKSIDVSKAKALKGVQAVLTAEDVSGASNHGLVIPDWPVLVGVGERVRYVGDAVAIVAATNRGIASEALQLIEVEYDELPVISSAVQAKQPETDAIHEDGNLLKHIKVRKGDTSEGFDQADVVLEKVFYTNPNDHAFLEPECSIARPLADGRMEIYVGSQIPYADRSQTAQALGQPDQQVRVVGQLMGGGFGGKEDIAGQIHAAMLAEVTGKPVKVLYDRQESLIAHPKRHATQIKVKVGAGLDGKLTAVETELYGDTGAYASLGEKVMGRATAHSSGPYEIPHMKADCYAMYTNNPPAGAFRGFGVLQSAFAVETMMDEIAENLGIDPVALRLENALKVGSTTNTGQVLRESVGLVECIERVDAEMRSRCEGNPFAPLADSDNPHLVTAWGFGAAYKNTGFGGGAPDKASAEVELMSDGSLAVRTSSAELGQGLVTVLEMIVAEEFDVEADRVNALVMDTDLTPDGGPTTASRQTYVSGNAAKHAAGALKDAIAAVLAEKFDQPPENVQFIEGLAQVGENQLAFGEIVDIMQEQGLDAKALYEYWAPETQPLGTGGDMHVAFSFAAQAAKVLVNSRTGEVDVLEVIAANDVGKALNPLGLQGQVEGGVVMGVGHALTEKMIIEEGHVVTDRMAKYRIPRIDQSPEITSIIVEHPTAEGPYGAKGVGEIVTIPTIPAITNAVYNAVGVRITSLPIDQEVVLKGINEKK